MKFDIYYKFNIYVIYFIVHLLDIYMYIIRFLFLLHTLFLYYLILNLCDNVFIFIICKIWSSICIQDIVKPELHYQINLIRLTYIITRFLYQICLIDKSDENIY